MSLTYGIVPNIARVGNDSRSNFGDDIFGVGENAAAGQADFLAGSGAFTLRVGRANTTLIAPSNVQLNDILGILEFGAWAAQWFGVAKITSTVTDGTADNRRPGSDLRFYTNLENDVQTLRGLIRNNGNWSVGGTEATIARMDVWTPGANSLQYALTLRNPNGNNGGGTYVGLAFSVDGSASLAKGAMLYERTTLDWGRGRLLICQNEVADVSYPTASDVVAVVENNGHFGIGHQWTRTVVPESMLHVADSSLSDIILQTSAGSSLNSVFYGRKSRGTVAAPTNIVASDYYIAFTGVGRSSAQWWETASIRFLCDGAVTDGQRPPSSIEFWTNPSNAVPALRFKIDTAGVWNWLTAANESTGAGAALLGANCPAGTLAAPYTWITQKTSDGSTVFGPVWK